MQFDWRVTAVALWIAGALFNAIVLVGGWRAAARLGASGRQVEGDVYRVRVDITNHP